MKKIKLRDFLDTYGDGIHGTPLYDEGILLIGSIAIFTQEDFNPSEKTLRFIRQFAYSYRVCKLNNQSCSYSLN